MKILFTCLVLMCSMSSIFFSQVKMQHHAGALVKSDAENLVLISNDSYAIIVGAIQHAPGLFYRTISVTNLNNMEAKQVQFETTTNDNADLFGHHITQSSFVFFENVYNQKEHVSSLVQHELNLKTFDLKRNVVFKDKESKLKPQIKFVHNPISATSALYSIVYNRGASAVEVHFLDDRFNIRRTEKAEFKATLDYSFDWRLEMNSLGELMMFHKLAVEEKGTTFVYHFIDNSNAKVNEKSLKVMYSNEHAQIEDVKVYLNDNSQVEFTALTIENRGLVISKKIVFMTFFPAKDAPLSEQSFELKIGDNARLHSFLPLNEEFSIVITKSNQISRALPDVALTLNDVVLDSRRSDRQEKQVLTIFYIHNNKGVLYQSLVDLDLDKTQFGDKIYSEQAFDYSFWSDGRMLFALHNAANSVDNQIEASNVIMRSSEVNQSRSLLVPSLAYFEIGSGMSKETEPITGVKMNNHQILPSTFQIHSAKQAVVIAQMERQVFVPVVINF